jgi:hypothetical protein
MNFYKKDTKKDNEKDVNEEEVGTWLMPNNFSPKCYDFRDNYKEGPRAPELL